METDDKKPELWMFVGPNGSGKSSVTKNFQKEPEFPKCYINADDIKKDYGFSDKEAQEAAHKMVSYCLKNKRSFAYETVGSHESKADWMQEAKDLGFHVKLYFVCTQDPSINIERVAERVESGGHNVPEDKIISRYGRSLALLPREFAIANEALVFNNSWTNPVLIAGKDKNGNVYIFAQNKDNPQSRWTEEEIKTLIGYKPPEEKKPNNKEIDILLATRFGKTLG